MFTVLTCLAALSFSIGGYYMKLSAGLTQFRPTVLVFVFFAVGVCLQTVAMQGQQMAVTYVVVLGFEAITAFCLGAFFLQESATLMKFAGIGLVLVGITLLRTAK